MTCKSDYKTNTVVQNINSAPALNALSNVKNKFSKTSLYGLFAIYYYVGNFICLIMATRSVQNDTDAVIAVLA